jgi:arylsulfatase A-like enzyme
VQLAWASCLLGLLLALGSAAVELSRWERPLDFAIPVLSTEVLRGLAHAAVAVAVWLVGFSVLRRWITHDLWRARLAAFAPWLHAQITLVGFTNAFVVEGMPTARRAVIHIGLGVALFLAAELGARALLAWHDRGWRPGRRPPLAWVSIVLVGLLSVQLIDRQSRALDERPNVIVILIDVLRADHLGAYGYERATSPRIDRFAEDSILFEQAISQSSFTKTSVSSLFSSLYPYRHGVYHGSLTDTASNITSDVLPDAVTTVAEAFREAGYLTAAWSTNPHLRAYMGFDQGFERYRDQTVSASQVASEFAHWNRTWGPRRRFFAYLHVMDLHAPYNPKPPWDTMFGAYGDDFTGMRFPAWKAYREAVRNGEKTPSENEIVQLKERYDGQVAYVDSVVGGIFDALERDGLYDDALIVVTGDHGDAFMEHGFLAHSNTPYDELIRVPLIVKLPHAAHAGLRVAEPVGLVDVMPTLLDAVGAQPVDGVDGVSQWARIAGEADASSDRPIVSEYGECIAVRTDGWKYLACGERPPELFRLARDPGETTNVIAMHPGIAGHMGALADAARALRAAPRDRVLVDPETVGALEALGYL